MMRKHEEKGIAFGRATAPIADELAALSYPITKQDLMAVVGRREIRYDAETKTFLAEIVRGVPDARFRDAHHAATALDERWRRIAAALREVERGAAEKKARG